MASAAKADTLAEALNCSICLDLFAEPVSLSCGHNFCHTCITEFWRNKEINSCPECGEVLPETTLRINRALASLAEKARKSTPSSKRAEGILCKQHQEDVMLFCDDDNELICLKCVAAPEHGDHRFMSINEAVETYKDQMKSSLETLTAKQAGIVEMEWQQRLKISRIKEQSLKLQSNIKNEYAKMHRILSEKEQRLIRELKKQEENFLEMMGLNLQEIQDYLSTVDVKVSKLNQRMYVRDGMALLKEEALHKTRMAEEENQPALVEVGLAIEKFNGPIQYITWKEMIDSLNTAPVPLTLDPRTANPWLIVNKDQTSVWCGNRRQELPDTPMRFDRRAYVLGSEGFASGRHYWEVEVGDKIWWGVGVVKESASRKGSGDLRPETGFFTVCRLPGKGLVEFSSPSRGSLTPSTNPRNVGVFLDYEAGQVSFYNADDMSHLHTYTHTFMEKVFPIFSPGRNDAGDNSAPLRIRRVKSERLIANMAVRPDSFADELNCSVCLDIFNSPVTLECGHNFCRTCITECWEGDKKNSCPECRKEFKDRKFMVNWALANMAQKAKMLNRDPKVQGSISVCEEHDEELKLFCETDKKLICLICRDAREHRGHRFMPIKEAVEIYMDRIKSSFDSLTEEKVSALRMEQAQKMQISGVKEHLSSLQSQVSSEFTKMHQSLRKKEERLMGDLKDQERRIVGAMEKNLQQIQQYLSSVHGELSTLEKKMKETNRVKFLKDEIRQNRRVISGSVTLSLVDTALSIEKLTGPFQYKIWRELIDAVKPAPASLTLDPDTAHFNLILSEDQTSVRIGDQSKELPDNPRRFDRRACVLGSDGFTSGKHYWEVEVATKTSWELGVTLESSQRKGKISMKPETGYYAICLVCGNSYVALTSPRTCLTPGVKPSKIGVYLDYELGQVSFYNADSMSLLHTFTHTLRGMVFPFFNPGLNDGGKNSAPLIICGVK
ncbi:uncharacterized protein LOC132394832 [Hypanus sabinus]|uniref:uncharacterized protein LOC132394832 n=1 Tax=Hypanus sabinus TaxID=79690 RepID=UPI0028C3B06D|nr:uncharacterized protein LOC132394832 [Hypanus sabinus]